MVLLLVRAFSAAEAEHLFFFFFIFEIFLFPISHWILVTKRQEDFFFFNSVWGNSYSNCKMPGTLRRGEGAAGGCLCQAVLQISLGC